MAGKGKDEELEEELEDEVDDEEVDDDDDDPEEQDDDESKKKQSKSGTNGSGAKKGGKTFNQRQVSKMMANEKRQGKASVFNALGIDPDDADTINAVKALVAERTKSAASKSDEADDGETTEYQERALMAEAKVDAMLLGCKPKFVEDVVTLALSKAADSGSDFKTVVGELKTKYPDWFGEESDDDDDTEGKSKASKKKSTGTGSSIKKAQKRKKDEEQSLGARLAAQRVAKTGKEKKSYWS